MTEPATTQIDQWRVMEALGTGDFATVYRVEADEGEFALKLCVGGNRAALERMTREVAALQALDHPNIPRYVTSGAYEERPYVVMSLARGKTLKEAIEQHERSGALHGDIQAMKILEKLLEAISHIHEQNLVHRDVKDANVIASSSGSAVTLIDFGFCKKAGMTEILSGDSFFRVGATRFSPPVKLSSPGNAIPVHDVFAAGVIGYRLLTGDYPWSVSRTEDYSALRHLQLTQRLVSVVEKNSHVALHVSDIISKLLRINDDERPTAAEALEDVRSFLAAVQSSPVSRAKAHPTYPHVRRDPIYGDVRLTGYERQVLDTREMQRLRFVKQLGLTNLVYDSADHSRLTHSVGCVARVEQILRAIEDQEGVRIEDELRLTARLYALTHDVTHIPFGHTLEDEFGFFPRHDENRARIERLLFRSGSELGRALRDRDEGRTVLNLFVPDPAVRPVGAVIDLVSGVMGADVLDYIDRDALFCGLDHRVDSAIFRQLRLEPLPRTDGRRLISRVWDRYGIRLDREYAFEGVVQHRYAMFLKIYTHRTKIAASALLAKGMTEALYPPGSARPLFREENLEELGVADAVVLERMRQAKRPAVKLAADQIVSRRLPIGVYRAELLERPDRTEQNYLDRQHRLKAEGLFDPRSRAMIEAEIAREAKLDSNQVMVYCPSQAPGYQRVEHWVSSARDASPTRHEPAFGLEIARRHLGLWELWVFVAADTATERTRSIVADVAQARFGFRNVIDKDRRDGAMG